jgi:hypothetical protein
MFVVRLPAHETEGLWLVWSVLFIIEVLCIITVFGYHFILKYRNHSVRSHGEPVHSPPESKATISNAPSIKIEEDHDGG